MQEQERTTVHGPYDTAEQADADAAHVYQATRGHRYPAAEMQALSPFHSVARIPVADRINEGLLLGALTEAGVELGAHDRRIIGWFSGWEPSIVQVVIGWIERAHAAGHSAGNLGANWAHHVAANRGRQDDEVDEVDVMDTCGDCSEGRCHWGGEQSRAGIAAVAADPLSDRPCGCARHEISYRYRVQQHERNGGA